MSKGIRLSEGFVLAMFPVLGIAVVAFHQLGRQMFYGVPLELFELDTAKIILSAAPFALYGFASLYSVTMLYNSVAPPQTQRALVHLLLAGFVTAPFWIGSIRIGSPFSWSTVAFVGFFAFFTLGTEHFWRRLTAKGRPAFAHRVQAVAGISLAAGVLVLGAAFAHGAIVARDQPSRTFIEGTNQIVVFKSGDIFVTKTYDPRARIVVPGSTVLVPITERTILVTRKAPIE